MKQISKNKKAVLLACITCVVAAITGLAACAPAASESTDNEQPATAQEETPAPVETPEPDEFGVVEAASWADAYPLQYASYEDNLLNAPGEEKHNYLELYPALNTMYQGFGFSKGYDEAASHLYSLESVTSTPRISEKSLANCITCKTPQFTALVNENGVSEYSKPFAETIALMTEPISCYNCHENDPTSLTVGNQFFVTALGSDKSNVPEQAQVCGQCHNEYYFDPETKATTLPYSGLAEMTPDAILAYYDEMGFSDWLYPGTDTPMLKVQHPEFETVYGGEGSHMAGLGYSCADCHMGTTTSDDGEEYTSHFWVSPLENPELVDSKCKSCHPDLGAQVAAWQEESESRVQSISLKIEDLANKMVAGVADGSLTGDKLAELQTLHRNAQFYWDFIMVENSEGAHNPAFSTENLDKAEAAVDQALGML